MDYRAGPDPKPADASVPVTLFGRRVSLSAVLVMGAGVVIAVAVALVSPLASLVALLMFAIAAYNVNCTHVGRCHVFAWFLTAIWLLYATTMLAAVLGGRALYGAVGAVARKRAKK